MTQKSFETQPTAELEEDVEFAHAVANVLNNLIDKGIITTQAVSQAEPRKFAEFALRYEKPVSQQGLGFSQQSLDKIANLFPDTQHFDQEQGLKRRAETIEKVRGILNLMQKKDQRICGLLIFGSRIDPAKSVRAESDLDVIPIIEGDYLIYAQGKTEPFRLLREVYKEDLKDSNIPLTTDEADYSSNEFLRLLEDNSWLPNSTPVWSWDKESVYFVDKIGERDEREINELIQNYIKSPQSRSNREKRINKIKEYVKS